MSRLPLEGRCLCGEVRYASSGAPGRMWYCHCRSCAKTSGAGFGTWVAVPKVNWKSGALARSSLFVPQDIARSFCRTCGSQLPAEYRDGSGAMLPAGGLDTVYDLKPTRHACTEQRASWLPICAKLGASDASSDCGTRATGIRSAARTSGLPVQGSCLCGAVVFTATGPPYAMRVCHCSRCRRRSGSSYFVGLACAASTLRIFRGKHSTCTWQLPGSARYIVHFCSKCGCSIPSIIRNTAFIPAGCLDADPGVRTRCHIYVGSRASWSETDDDLPRFQQLPPQDFNW